MQIPAPYNFVVQVRFKDQPIYESYFAKLVSLTDKKIANRVELIEGVHLESENMRAEKFKRMPFEVGYDNVIGFLVIRVDGEILASAGDMKKAIRSE